VQIVGQVDTRHSVRHVDVSKEQVDTGVIVVPNLGSSGITR
jgi:hypothetical protein